VTKPTMIPLPVAAFTLGQTYRAAYELLMSRRLRGELRGKRWWVNLEDVRKLDRSEEQESVRVPKALAV
jgi:hypothetical protein